MSPDKLERIDTVRPAGGPDGDAYSAETKVGETNPELLAAIRASRVPKFDTDTSETTASAPQRSDVRPTAASRIVEDKPSKPDLPLLPADPHVEIRVAEPPQAAAFSAVSTGGAPAEAFQVPADVAQRGESRKLVAMLLLILFVWVAAWGGMVVMLAGRN